MKIKVLFALLICAVSFASAQGFKEIAANDPRIHISGAPFSKYGDELVILQRHSDALLAMPRRFG